MTANPIIIYSLLAIFIAVLLYSLYSLMTGGQSQVTFTAYESRHWGQSIKQANLSIARTVSKRLSNADKIRYMNDQFQIAGMSFTYESYLTMKLIVAIVMVLVVAWYLNNPLAGLISAPLFYNLPDLWLNRMMRAKNVKMDRQIQVFISSLGRLLITENNVAQAVQEAVKNMSNPLKAELQRILSSVSYKRSSISEEFTNFARRSGRPEMLSLAKILESATDKSLEAGAEACKRLALAVSEQERLRRERESQLSEDSLLVIIFLILMPVSVIVMHVLSPFTDKQLTHTTIGFISTSVATAIEVALFLVYRSVTSSADIKA